MGSLRVSSLPCFTIGFNVCERGALALEEKAPTWIVVSHRMEVPVFVLRASVFKY